jgi:hypothetical protein
MVQGASGIAQISMITRLSLQIGNDMLQSGKSWYPFDEEAGKYAIIFIKGK